MGSSSADFSILHQFSRHSTGSARERRTGMWRFSWLILLVALLLPVVNVSARAGLRVTNTEHSILVGIRDELGRRVHRGAAGSERNRCRAAALLMASNVAFDAAPSKYINLRNLAIHVAESYVDLVKFALSAPASAGEAAARKLLDQVLRYGWDKLKDEAKGKITDYLKRRLFPDDGILRYKSSFTSECGSRMSMEVDTRNETFTFTISGDCRCTRRNCWIAHHSTVRLGRFTVRGRGRFGFKQVRRDGKFYLKVVNVRLGRKLDIDADCCDRRRPDASPPAPPPEGGAGETPGEETGRWEALPPIPEIPDGCDIEKLKQVLRELERLQRLMLTYSRQGDGRFDPKYLEEVVKRKRKVREILERCQHSAAPPRTPAPKGGPGATPGAPVPKKEPVTPKPPAPKAGPETPPGGSGATPRTPGPEEAPLTPGPRPATPRTPGPEEGISLLPPIPEKPCCDPREISELMAEAKEVGNHAWRQYSKALAHLVRLYRARTFADERGESAALRKAKAEAEKWLQRMNTALDYMQKLRECLAQARERGVCEKTEQPLPGGPQEAERKVDCCDRKAVEQLLDELKKKAWAALEKSREYGRRQEEIAEQFKKLGLHDFDRTGVKWVSWEDYERAVAALNEAQKYWLEEAGRLIDARKALEKKCKEARRQGKCRKAGGETPPRPPAPGDDLGNPSDWTVPPCPLEGEYDKLLRKWKSTLRRGPSEPDLRAFGDVYVRPLQLLARKGYQLKETLRFVELVRQVREAILRCDRAAYERARAEARRRWSAFAEEMKTNLKLLDTLSRNPRFAANPVALAGAKALLPRVKNLIEQGFPFFPEPCQAPPGCPCCAPKTECACCKERGYWKFWLFRWTVTLREETLTAEGEGDYGRLIHEGVKTLKQLIRLLTDAVNKCDKEEYDLILRGYHKLHQDLKNLHRALNAAAHEPGLDQEAAKRRRRNLRKLDVLLSAFKDPPPFEKLCLGDGKPCPCCTPKSGPREPAPGPGKPGGGPVTPEPRPAPPRTPAPKGVPGATSGAPVPKKEPVTPKPPAPKGGPETPPGGSGATPRTPGPEEAPLTPGPRPATPRTPGPEESPLTPPEEPREGPRKPPPHKPRPPVRPRTPPAPPEGECAPGEVWKDGACVPRKRRCGKNQRWDGRKCITVKKKRRKVICKRGHVYSRTKGRCVRKKAARPACRPGYVYSRARRRCVPVKKRKEKKIKGPRIRFRFGIGIGGHRRHEGECEGR